MGTHPAQRTGRLEAVLEGDGVRLLRVQRGAAAFLAAGSVPPGQVSAPGYPLDGTVRAAEMLLRAPLEDAGFGMFQIEDESGRVVGDLGFHGPPDAQGRVEIGYGLVPDVRGHGLMTRAVHLLVEHAFLVGGVIEVTAHVDEGNDKSEAVLMRVGMVEKEPHVFSVSRLS